MNIKALERSLSQNEDLIPQHWKKYGADALKSYQGNLLDDELKKINKFASKVLKEDVNVSRNNIDIKPTITEDKQKAINACNEALKNRLSKQPLAPPAPSAAPSAAPPAPPPEMLQRQDTYVGGQQAVSTRGNKGSLDDLSKNLKATLAKKEREKKSMQEDSGFEADFEFDSNRSEDAKILQDALKMLNEIDINKSISEVKGLEDMLSLINNQEGKLKDNIEYMTSERDFKWENVRQKFAEEQEALKSASATKSAQHSASPSGNVSKPTLPSKPSSKIISALAASRAEREERKKAEPKKDPCSGGAQPETPASSEAATPSPSENKAKAEAELDALQSRLMDIDSAHKHENKA